MQPQYLPLLALFLFIPQQIVSAECGWVLWWKTDVIPQSARTESVIKTPELNKDVQLGTWKPHAAFDTRQECINRMYQTHRTFKENTSASYKVGPNEPLLSDNKMGMGLYYPHRTDIINLECWPSNIKPE